MNKHAIMHIPMTEYAHALSETKMLFRLRAAKGDLTACTLYFGDRCCPYNPIKLEPVAMSIAHSDELFDWWQAEFDTPYRRICYYFKLESTKESKFYYAEQFCEQVTQDRVEYFQIPYIHRDDIAKMPDWIYDAIVYNIFPDSFATGKRSISMKPVTKQWRGETVKGKHGGTIRGIIENADYLSELGVNCAYFNPLFAAGEYHKYDLIDYFNVDPCFGTNDDFKEMVEELHKRNIKVIIDGVFNHCGWHFFAFDDVVKNGTASRYADWFYRLDFPVIRPESGKEPPGYECFAYERRMPKLNTANREVEEYFCKVCQHWLQEYDVDGWRLDVADEVNDAFWRAFRRAAVEIKPDALLIGEIWGNANHWLDGTMFHSAMNYDFRKNCREFFAQGLIKAEEFGARVTKMLTRYRDNLAYAQLNLLDSHDVSRFLWLCGNDKRRLKLGLLFKMCFIGIPCIYYGAEQGLCGEVENDYRQPMIWDGDKELQDFYKWAIDLRKNSPALKRGCFKLLCAEGSLFVFKREFSRDAVTVAMNVGDKPAVYAGQEIEPFGYRIDES